jgi:hypothetical protein
MNAPLKDLIRRRAADEAIRLLAEADRFNRLAKMCPQPHREAFYRLKDHALEKAILAEPDRFRVDSIALCRVRIVGFTHTPSGRRFHYPLDRIPASVRKVLRHRQETQP